MCPKTLKKITFLGMIIFGFLGLFSGTTAGEEKIIQGAGEEEGIVSLEAEKDFPPRIDEEGAFISREDYSLEKEIICGAFSENFWIFLFGVYLFLLVFNLSAQPKKSGAIRWFWELIFTFLALGTQEKLDPGGCYRWFSFCVVETGVIIYSFYLYSFLASSGKENQE